MLDNNTIKYEYQQTDMPGLCFHSACATLRRLDVPRVGDDRVLVSFWMDDEGNAEAMEVLSERDEHGCFLTVRRFIRVPVELPMTEWSDKQLNDAMWLIEDAQDEDVDEHDDNQWHAMFAVLMQRHAIPLDGEAR